MAGKFQTAWENGAKTNKIHYNLESTNKITRIPMKTLMKILMMMKTFSSPFSHLSCPWTISFFPSYPWTFSCLLNEIFCPWSDFSSWCLWSEICACVVTLSVCWEKKCLGFFFRKKIFGRLRAASVS